MSWHKRYGHAGDSSPPPGGDDSRSDDTIDLACAVPLFLNSGDKSVSPREAYAARRAAAGDRVVEAMFGIARQFYRAADDALADERVNVDSGDYMSLRETGNVWDLRACRVRDCGRMKSIPYHCANGHRWEVVPMGCGLRLCPHCEGRAAGHVRERLRMLLGAFRNPVRMLTLTMRNQNELHRMLDDLVRAFDHLRKSRIWRRSVVGAVAVFECTASEDRGWHAHIHVAWDGRFMPWSEVLAAWKEATNGEGQRVDLRGNRWPKERAVNYLSKYASKGVRVLDLPDAMVQEFVQAWWRFRTLRAYGTMFCVQMPAMELWDGVVRCPRCGLPGTAFGLSPNVPSLGPRISERRCPGATPRSRVRVRPRKLFRLPPNGPA